jgi:multidrug resistance efflux pump
MAKRKPKEDQMETNSEPGMTPDEQEELGQDLPQPEQGGDEPRDPVEGRDYETEEAQLKAQLQALKKQKKEANKGTKAEKQPKEKKEKAARPAKDEANGITRPAMGVTKEVWDTADMLSKRLGTYVDRSTLTEALNGRVEIGTIHTQYGRWRKYYGLVETADQRAARMAQIRAKKLADLGEQQPQVEPQGEQQEEETQ